MSALLEGSRQEGHVRPPSKSKLSSMCCLRSLGNDAWARGVRCGEAMACG